MSLSRRQTEIVDALSALDDAFVERVSVKRMALLKAYSARVHRRRIAVISAAGLLAAALLLLAVLIPLIILPNAELDGGDYGGGVGTEEGGGEFPTPSKRIPIYRGMSVSNQAPTVAASAHGAERILLCASPRLSAMTYASPLVALRTGEESGVGGTDGYFAAKHTDVYITVHIENPDGFEIVSFTLGGVKYTDYMFEDGSDMENIIIKRNVGDADGILSLTIDAIKYIDGTELRDVRMEGDRTVEITITPDEQPTAELTLTPTLDAIHASVVLTDPLSLIGESEGEGVTVSLFDGETLLRRLPLARGETAASFEGLSSAHAYTVTVDAVYDAIDGKGVSVHPLASETVTTPTRIAFGECVQTGLGLRFSLNIHPESGVTLPDVLELWQGDALVATLPSDTVTLEGLSASTAYTLRARVAEDDGTVEAVYEFVTPATYETVFETNGGVPLAPQFFLAGEALPVPQREGFTFGGWFSDAALSVAVESAPAEAMTLYAYWTEELRPREMFFEVDAAGVTVTGLAAHRYTELTLPAYVGGLPVTALEAYALLGQVGVQKITLPDTLVSIGKGAFRDCAALVSLNIPSGVTQIPADAFDGCASLREEEGGVIYVNDWAVGIAEPLADGAPRLLNVRAGTRGVSDGWMSGSLGIRGVIFPEGFLYLGARAIGSASGLQFVLLPASVRAVGAGALTDPISDPSFDAFRLYYGGTYKAWSDVASESGFSESATRELIAGAFLFEGEEFSDVYVVGTRADLGTLLGVRDPSAASCHIPRTVPLDAILPYAFSECTALQSIVIPENVRRIEEYAFAGAPLLTELSVDVSVEIRGSINDTFPHLRTLSVEGTGDLRERVFERAEHLEAVTLSEGVTGVGQYCFAWCPSLVSVSFGGVEDVGAFAFQNCTALRAAVFSDSLRALGERAFAYCTSLEEINVPAHTAFGERVLEGCRVKRARVPCAGIEEVYEYVEDLTVCGGAFDDEGGYWGPLFNCLRTLTVLDVETVGFDVGPDQLFMSCPYLETVVIGKGVKKLESQCFRDCRSLRSITLGEDLTQIGTDCFVGCPVEEVTVYPTFTRAMLDGVRGIFYRNSELRPVPIVFCGTRAQWARCPLRELCLSDEYVRCTDDP